MLPGGFPIYLRMAKRETAFRLPINCLRRILNLNRGHFLILRQSTINGYTFTSPPENVATKYGKTKNVRRPSIAKRTTSMKKVMYAIFFNSRGETVQVAIDITQDRLLGQQCFSSLRVYLRKTTRKLSISGLKDLNFAFFQRGSILK